MRIDLDSPCRENWNLQVEFGRKQYHTRRINEAQEAAIRAAMRERPFPLMKMAMALDCLFEGTRRPVLSSMRIDQLMELAQCASLEYLRCDYHRTLKAHRIAIEQAKKLSQAVSG